MNTILTFAQFKEIWDDTKPDSYNSTPPVSYPQNGTSKALADALNSAYEKGEVLEAPDAIYGSIE